jgi:diguanylate cyclase (GGDEF)-like protein
VKLVIQTSDYALIAEFDPHQAAVYRQVVEGQGFDVVVVRCGDAAKRALRTYGVPVVLITDLSLPRSDGFALISELRRLAPHDKSVVIVLSAFSALRTRARALQTSLGISEIADKKLSPAALRHMVVRALEGLPLAAPAPPLELGAIERLLRTVLSRSVQTFKVPIASISLDIGHRLWITMYVDSSHRSSGELDMSWPWTMLQRLGNTREPFIVPDIAAHDPGGLLPPAAPTQIRGLVTVPLLNSADRVTGALSLMDLKPLALDARQIDLLVDLARRVADEFDRRPLCCSSDQARRTPHHEHEDRLVVLERLALTDPLTELPNRRAGEQALAREMARARRLRSDLCLALLDVDRFKKVNDLHGHAVGDQVLGEISRILRMSLRASDLAVRWGGDEFLVLLPDITLDGALAFLHRIRTQVEGLSIRGVERFTWSAGVVAVGSDEDARVALVRADAKLYEAKAAGGNCVKG